LLNIVKYNNMTYRRILTSVKVLSRACEGNELRFFGK